MKKKLLFLAIVLSILFSGIASAQSSPFDITAYLQFLQQNSNMNTGQLLQMYPAGYFKSSIPSGWETALYHDSIEIKYGLTDYELSLINQHGFAVTERNSANSFGDQFLNIYHSDLPVFISTDAILHAVHMSYDQILIETELGILLDDVTDFLNQIHSKMSDLEAAYSSNTGMQQMLKDVDVFLTVPRKLLNANALPYYSSNDGYIDTLLYYIYDEDLQQIKFFSSSVRYIDFSQFKPRGHYALENYPQLAKYFRAMIWLGRMELYLIAPRSNDPQPTFKDIQRQAVIADLVNELIDLSGTENLYNDIENTIEFYVGEQDNVSPINLKTLLLDISINSADQLLDSTTFSMFQDSLSTRGFAFQRILSQVLARDPMNPDSIVPASSYLVFGQRFIIDSYITGNVVFDKIVYDGHPVRRMLPSTLDILFGLGNDAAAQLLVPQLNRYHYAQNLAGLRYLVDNYDNDYWQSTIYNLWLNSVRALNPPENRNDLPAFMQTAAWWQEKMNTQLSSWSQLRHDNLLYAKQSYSGIPICSYPYGYVEPVPEFYNAVKTMAEVCKIRFADIPFNNSNFKQEIINYYSNLAFISDTLKMIAEKELEGTPFTNSEALFLQRIVYDAGSGCAGPEYDGWYPKLFFGSSTLFIDKNFTVADYHTAPGDEAGNIVGWVAHAGTGNVDLAILSAVLPGNLNVAFIGPVLSYHEYTSTNFLRLTDQEWSDEYLAQSTRPDWVNIYLADNSGNSLGSGGELLTSLKEDETGTEIPETHIIARNYPNPFNAETIINFKIPQSLTNALTQVNVYDITGRLIKVLLKETLPPGNYLTRWDGKNSSGSNVSSGIYLYEIKAGANKFVGKMSLMK